jgi:hypothetical protein
MHENLHVTDGIYAMGIIYFAFWVKCYTWVCEEYNSLRIISLVYEESLPKFGYSIYLEAVPFTIGTASNLSNCNDLRALAVRWGGGTSRCW